MPPLSLTSGIKLNDLKTIAAAPSTQNQFDVLGNQRQAPVASFAGNSVRPQQANTGFNGQNALASLGIQAGSGATSPFVQGAQPSATPQLGNASTQRFGVANSQNLATNSLGALGNANTQPMGTGNTISTTNPNANYFNDGSFAGGNTGSTGGGSGTGGAGGLLGGAFNSQSQQYLSSQLDVINRLAALQGQMAASQVPSDTEIQQQNLGNQLQLNLSNLNPQQFLKDNPTLQANGISQPALQREIAQQQVPIEQELSQAILSKTALANLRTNTTAALGAQAQGLAAQGTALDQARQLSMFGGLPPDIASAVIQKQLFPPYQTFTNLAGMPGVVSEGPGGTFNSQLLGGVPGQGSAGQAGGFGGASGLPTLQGQPASINIGGLDIPMEYSGQNAYINSTRLSDSQQKVAQLYSAQTGVPVLDTTDVAALHTIGEAEQYLPAFQQAAQQLLSPGVLGRLQGFTTNQLSQVTQSDPRWRQFQTLRAGLIKSVQGIASGAPGLRVTGAELENAAEALPNSTDNLESAQQAISTFEQLLNVNKQVLLGSGQAQGGQSQSGGAQGGSGLYNF